VDFSELHLQKGAIPIYLKYAFLKTIVPKSFSENHISSGMKNEERGLFAFIIYNPFVQLQFYFSVYFFI